LIQIHWGGGTLGDSCLNLEGRIAVVIGASSGLGLAIAKGLALHGADVIPTGRRRDWLEKACQGIEAAGRRTLRQPVDIVDRSSIDALRDVIVGHFGRVDILINAAGRTSRKPTLDVKEHEWLSLFNTNLNGALRACQSFHEVLRASGRGRIINVASLGSFLAFHEVAAYCSAKAALLSLTRSLACEWARDGISVNAIAPGFFPTAMNDSLLSGTERGREILMRTPMRRFGRPEELIGAAVLLASDGASFITGQCLVVDGGYLASGVNS
jgi:NAD(P)-dependent dehydrogenase (short-subunit alcohol dehydrogenase family)